MIHIRGDARMHVGLADQRQAGDDRQRIVGLQAFLKALPEARQAIVKRFHARQIHGKMLPTDHIECLGGDLRGAVGLPHNHHAALFAHLADMPALNTPGKNHRRIGRDDFRLVDMPQGPVVIAFVDQIVQGAGGVVLMPLSAGKAGVQQPDIEISWHRFGIIDGQVVRHRRLAKLWP